MIKQFLIIVLIASAFCIFSSWKKIQSEPKLKQQIIEMRNKKKMSTLFSTTTTPSISVVDRYAENKDLAIKLVQTLADLNCQVLRDIMLNSTELIFNNYHYKIDWNGNYVRDENNNVVRSGFYLKGLDQILEVCNSVADLEASCLISNHSFDVEPYTNGFNGYPFNQGDEQVNVKVVWRGLLSGYWLPSIDSKIDLENGIYHILYGRDSYKNLKIAGLYSHDVEINFPYNKTLVVYAQPTHEARCDKLRQIYTHHANKVELFPMQSSVAGGKRILNINPGMQ